ncbi:MAG: pilus assembly protein PilM [Planctomycetes bacterium]|nr:pilus assembly protein PilM [Planctomycetota bacterium]
MSSLWFNKPRSPIGLDLGAQSIKLVQFEYAGAGYRLTAAACRAIPADAPASGPERTDALAALISQTLKTGGFHGKNVVSCMPATTLQYKNLRLPKMPPDELRAAIEWEATDRLKMSPETVSIQFYNAGEVRQGEELRQEIIVLAATHADIDEHLELLRKCELSPVAIDAVPSALARSLGSKIVEDEDAAATVIVDVGYASSKVLVLRQGRVLFFKLIDIGGKKLDATVAEHLHIPIADASDLRRRLQQAVHDEAAGTAQETPLFGSTRRETLERAVFEALRATAGELAKEIGLCLRYYSVTFRGRRPESALLVGGEAYETQLAKILTEGAGVEMIPAKPLEGIEVPADGELSSRNGVHSEWAVALGLAMRRDEKAARRGAA